MNEPDVTITDLALAVLCLWLAWRYRAGKPLARALAGMYLSLALAAFCGGIVHGFLGPGPLREGLWAVTLLAIGSAACFIYAAAGRLLLGRAGTKILERALVLAWLSFLVLVCIGARSFAVAIGAYLPAVLLLAWGFGRRARVTGDPRWLVGMLGLLVTLVAAAIQQREVDLHPVYLTHNALFHVLQGIGLLAVGPVCSASQNARPMGGSR